MQASDTCTVLCCRQQPPHPTPTPPTPIHPHPNSSSPPRRVTVGGSCLCCCVCVTSFERWLTPLFVDSAHALWASFCCRFWMPWSITDGRCHKYHYCRDKHVCHDKARLLLRQKYACRDKTFVATKLCLSRQTRVCFFRDKTKEMIFFATKPLSRQAYSCRDKIRVFSRQIRVCCDKTFVSTKITLEAAQGSYRPVISPAS